MSIGSRIGLGNAASPGAIFQQPWQSGRYYFLPNVAATSTNSSIGNNLLRFTAFYVPNVIGVQRIGAEVTSAGDVGSKVRLGIYADDGTARPGALLLDAGTIAGDSATPQEITGLSLTLPPGLYWTAQVVQIAPGTTPTMRIHGTQGIVPNIDVGTSMPVAGSSGGAYLQVAGCTGALPNVAGAVNTSGLMPRLFMKVQ